MKVRLLLISQEKVDDRVSFLVEGHVASLIKLLNRTVHCRQIREELVGHLVVLVDFAPHLARGRFQL